MRSMALPAWSRGDESEPVSERIAWEFCRRIDDGRIPVGTRLPSIRAFAREAGVAPNTVRVVYERLREFGVAGGEGRDGWFVRLRPRDAGVLPALLLAYCRSLMALGNSKDAVRSALADALKEISS